MDELTNEALGLALSYMDAYRRADYEAMALMSGPHDGALMAALLMFADAIVPVIREAAGDEIYIETMNGLAEYPGDVSDLAPAIAVDMINSRGGIHGRRWTSGQVEMTAQTVVDTNFRMASTLNIMLDLSA